MSKTMLTTIPFQGFYESIWSAELYNVEDTWVENALDSDYGAGPHALADAIYNSADYGIARDYIARKYVEYFNDAIRAEYGIDLDLKFESMQSPHEYNFTTDRIFCEISLHSVDLLYHKVSPEELALAMKLRFTSRSGFISSYPNTLEGWPTSLAKWDHNQVGTLFEALIDDEDFERDILEDMADHNEFDTAFEKCVDWEKFEVQIREGEEA